MNPKVDQFLENARTWQNEMRMLRAIILECGLTEEYKWMHPCYTFRDSNVVLIHQFKEYCALLFHKGVLLKDTEGILIQQTKNVQAARQIRFTDISEIETLKPVVKAYIFEAVEVEKAGLNVRMKKTSEYEVPEELTRAFDKNSGLKTAFYALTPGRQRAYLLYFSQAKQEKTRVSRIEKYIPDILIGKGINDK
ncbi:YdeI/OmpD-associated family protein [Robertkochia solimangrovi]|uniref:YdeI/OmpD-associated family protein n=1 Tax=Robertkochia solimangrovi TaxID=2213046 RepID=UPI00117C44D8|nr:YdeI family protein [Robertkochia solimangrovi]TRZ46328.1 hypothetical protein DMZ48_03475 [Robertkochia solimangrovi]